MADQNEVKAALDEMRRTFEEHKKANDARLEALKADKATSDFDEKLDRINEALTKQERVQREHIKDQEKLAAKRAADDLEFQVRQQESERKLEARINRAALGLGGMDTDGINSDEKLHRRAYEKHLRFGAERLSADEAKVLTISNDPTGGYLAPPTFVQEIIKAEVLFSPMRSLVRVFTLSGPELQLPKRTQSAAATRTGETQTRAETTNPAWGLMKIQAPEMYAEARVSMANLEDSAFNLEELLTQEFAEQFGVLEGDEVIDGNGVGKCLGILDANAAGPGVPIAYTKSGTAATILDAAGTVDGVLGLFHAVKTAYAARGTWIFNRTTLGKLRLAKDANDAYIWAPGIALASPPTVLGAPYVECPDMPDEGANTFPMAFGDFKRAYALVDRLQMAIVRDPYTLAASGQVKFYARKRVGGQVILGEAIRLLKCEA